MTTNKTQKKALGLRFGQVIQMQTPRDMTVVGYAAGLDGNSSIPHNDDSIDTMPT